MDYEKRIKKLEQKAGQGRTFPALIEVRNGVYSVSVGPAKGVFSTEEEAEAFAKEQNAETIVEIILGEDAND